MTDAIVLGYDIRVGSTPLLKEPGYQQFLLRTDLEMPLSVDTHIWPSVFGRDAWTRNQFCVQDLWPSLSELMTSHGTRRWHYPQESWLIAVALAGAALGNTATLDDMRRADSFLADGGSEEPLPRTEPGAIASEWRLLGYDVATPHLLSGLMNCGYTDQDRVALADLAMRLNRYHLFESLDHARRYAADANQRVAEHAPFYAMGLWLLDRV